MAKVPREFSFGVLLSLIQDLREPGRGEACLPGPCLHPRVRMYPQAFTQVSAAPASSVMATAWRRENVRLRKRRKSHGAYLSTNCVCGSFTSCTAASTHRDHQSSS